MMCLSGNKEAEIIEAFNSTSRCLNDLFNIDNTYFNCTVNQIYLWRLSSQIYSSELQLIKSNSSDTEASILDLHSTISVGFVSSEIYDKRDDLIL